MTNVATGIASTTATAFKDLLTLLNRLEAAKLAYTLRKVRPEAIMVLVRVPGEHWEIEFVDYGDEVHVEVECYTSDGEVGDERRLDNLFADNAD